MVWRLLGGPESFYAMWFLLCSQWGSPERSKRLLDWSGVRLPVSSCGLACVSLFPELTPLINFHVSGTHPLSLCSPDFSVSCPAMLGMELRVLCMLAVSVSHHGATSPVSLHKAQSSGFDILVGQTPLSTSAGILWVRWGQDSCLDSLTGDHELVASLLHFSGVACARWVQI